MRRVLITAGANGIGLVMARAFQAAGDRVWVTDVDAAQVAALPPGIRGSVVDASLEPGMAALFAEIARDWGGLDVLCANAGSRVRRRGSRTWTLRPGTSASQSTWMAR